MGRRVPFFGLWWVVATVLGASVGAAVGGTLLALPASMLLYLTRVSADPDALIFGGIALAVVGGIGLGVGVGQWVVFRTRRPTRWWIPSTFVGTLAGAFAAYMLSGQRGGPGLPPAAGYAVFGIALGGFQWLVLRSLPRAYWWVPITGIACATGYFGSGLLRQLVAASPLQTTVSGIIAGFGTLFLGPAGFVGLAAGAGLVTAAGMAWLLGDDLWKTLRPALALAFVGGAVAYGASFLGPTATRGAGIASQVLSGHTRTIFAAAWGPAAIATLDAGDRVIVWGPEGARVAEFTVQGSPRSGLRWSADGRLLVANNTVWSAATHQVVATWPTDVVLSPDGRKAAAREGKRVVLWDLATKKRISWPAVHSAEIYSLAWSPDGQYLATGGFGDRIAVVWTADGKPVARLGPHEDGWIVVEWSLDGRFLSTATFDGDIRIWERGTWKKVATLRMPGSAGKVRWTQGYVAASGGGARVWSIPDFAEVGGPNFMTSGGEIAWGGKRLAAASGNEIHIYDAAARRTVAVLRGHVADVLAVSWNPDGKRLVGGGVDGEVRLWTVP